MSRKESINLKVSKNKATANWLPADVFILLKVLSSEHEDGGITKTCKVSYERVQNLLLSMCRIFDGVNQEYYRIGEREVVGMHSRVQ